MSRRSVTVLGATGSVGQSTLDLLERNSDLFEVRALTANSDVPALAAAARRVGASRAVIADPARAGELEEALAGSGIATGAGEPALLEAAASGADLTMAAIVGTAGLKPVMAALAGGGTVALANKEALVSAGEIMTDAARASGATILPVDSEHNAIFQCLVGAEPEALSRIILTASGGPFRRHTLDEMRAATPAEAVAHPNWSMGAKISVDSATMMNKGLELIEAFHLFPVGVDRLEIVVHPQSVVHSMVEFVDGSTLAQLGSPDMRVPIAFALAWPRRIETPCQPLDLVRIGHLSFEEPDLERFPCIALAREALRAGGASAAVLNAANEIAVAAFLGGNIGFLDIAAVVRETLERCDPAAPSSIEDVLEIDARAREIARQLVGKHLH